jgi:hypothetical protein
MGRYRYNNDNDTGSISDATSVIMVHSYVKRGGTCLQPATAHTVTDVIKMVM